MQQIEIPESKELMATNGKMLRLLTREVAGVPTANTYNSLQVEEDRMEIVGASPSNERPTWERLLDYVGRHGFDALIDAGGLVAGVSNSDAADYLLARLDESR